MMNVCVLGTGYVGLVTGACLAEIGHDVTCVDADPHKLAILRGGDIPIYEPGLAELVAQNRKVDRLRFTDDPGEALARNHVTVFVAVGTPTVESGRSDLSALFRAVEEIGRHRSDLGVSGFMVVVIKSTVPVGTCRKARALLSNYLPASQFAVVSNPEFLREGSAVSDFMNPDRIVVGSSSSIALMAMRRLYAPLTQRGHSLLEVSSIETSELIKYASNIFLATKIGLINEFARLCDTVGADILELSHAVGLDHRIGRGCLAAGPGFGGSCFPKDLKALSSLAREAGSPMQIAEAVIASNHDHKHAMVQKIRTALGGDVRGLKIALLGLSFKAGTDDVREAPALALIEELLASGADVSAYDPVAISATAKLYPEVEYCASATEAIADSDAIVVVTEWPEFRDLPFRDILASQLQPVIIDLRNLLDGEAVAAMGFAYVPLGRPESKPLLEKDEWVFTPIIQEQTPSPIPLI